MIFDLLANHRRKYRFGETSGRVVSPQVHCDDETLGKKHAASIKRVCGQSARVADGSSQSPEQQDKSMDFDNRGD